MVVPVFCHSRLLEEGNMIECCQYSEWYHEKCENIDEAWEKEEIDWVCIGCTRS